MNGFHGQGLLLRVLRLLIAAVSLTTAVSCEPLQEYLHMAAPEVVRILPEAGYADPASFREIEISFSGEMDRAKTERACSFSEGGTVREGVFRWSGRTLSFRPHGGFLANRRYTVTVGNGAEDPYGNSLLREVNHVLFTGQEQGPPEIIDTAPADGEAVDDLLAPISIMFSESMDRISFLRAFSLSPEVTGTIAWDESGAVATFTPLAPYPAGADVKVSVGTDAADVSGNTLLRPLRFRFTAGVTPDLRVAGLTASGTGAAVPDTDDNSHTAGIEKDEQFDIRFTEPVPQDRRTGILSSVPSVPFSLAWTSDFSSCRLTFDEPLEYLNLYELRILEKRYRILIDGPRSLPLVVERVTFCSDIGEAVPRYTELYLNAAVPVSGSPRSAFDFHLLHASGSEIDTASFLENVSVSSSVLPGLEIMAIQSLRIAGGDAPPPGTERTTVRLLCSIEAPVLAGIGRASLDTDFRDSFGNRLREAWSLPFQVLPE